MARTLTVLNSSFILSVPGVSPIPFEIQGYATDDAFDTEDVAPNEIKQGVDGILSGGHVAYPVLLKFSLQADSTSIDDMELWRAAEDAAGELYWATATIAVPGVGKIYTFNQGALTKAKPIPPGKKILDPQTYEITFQSQTVALSVNVSV